jgi:hypothetical protein
MRGIMGFEVIATREAALALWNPAGIWQCGLDRRGLRELYTASCGFWSPKFSEHIDNRISNDTG